MALPFRASGVLQNASESSRARASRTVVFEAELTSIDRIIESLASGFD
jgi:hypothetical protein